MKSEGPGTEDSRNSSATESVSEGSAISVDGKYSFKWLSGKDKGQTDAINKGFRMAIGDIRTWLNADEFYYPGALQAVSKFFTEKPETGLLYGQALFTREDGCPIRPTHHPNQNIFIYSDVISYPLQHSTMEKYSMRIFFLMTAIG